MKHWKPGKKTVELQPAARPSRIRREPVRLEKKIEERSREREIAGGIFGVLLIATVIVVLTVGIAVATIFKGPAAPEPAPFGQCYNSDGRNCVIDGDTIFVEWQKVELADIEAPEIDGAQCAQEKDRGIAAAVGLSNLLGSGNVTVSPLFRDDYGRAVRRIAVNGQDVAQYLINHSLVRRYTGERQKWCD